MLYRSDKALTVKSDLVTYYDDGVGAMPLVSTGARRAFGQLRRRYRTVTRKSHTYIEAGDELFLFGFSRGAYTVRSLAGMIANCGLPRGTFSDACVAQAFAGVPRPSEPGLPSWPGWERAAWATLPSAW